MKRFLWNSGPLILYCVFFLAAIAMIPVSHWLGGPDPAEAASPPVRPRQVVVLGGLTPVGFHQYTDLDTSCDFTDHGTYVIPAAADFAFVQAEGQNLRWRCYPRVAGDTTDPTAAIGMRLPAGDILEYRGNLIYPEFIEEAAGGIMNVTFFSL